MFMETLGNFDREDNAIYMVFKKISYYLYDANLMIGCHSVSLRQFLTVHILNSKVNIREQK